MGCGGSGRGHHGNGGDAAAGQCAGVHIWSIVDIDPTYGNTLIQSDGTHAKDQVYVIKGPSAAGAWTDSTGEYDIPWNYHVKNLDNTVTAPVAFYTMKQTAHIGVDGSTSTTKDQANSSTHINDPNNDFLGFLNQYR